MTETRSRIWRGFNAVLMLAVAAVLFGLPAAAQDDYQDDPPDRVARLGFLQGSVSMQPAGESDWVGAVSNRPITTGDKLWADQDSRAEVELGSATIRLAPNTGFSFLNLDDRTTQIELTAGSINIRVRRLDRNDIFEVDTPNQAFSVYRPGNYRVDVSDDGTYTVISVRDGEGESTGNGQSYNLHAGQRATFSGTDSLNADVVDLQGSDQFDDWAQTRDRRYDNSRSSRYVSQDVVGYEDLDDYGDWRDESDYGHVWYPNRVSSGWAPYRDGHWDWISPWGWTWVDDSPWGYAPFHYGRWVTVRGRWGWVSGPVAVRPVYAPALVVFIGGGGGFGGNVGWFPLGPREVYVPSYRVSRGYVDRVNVSNTNVNVTNITNVYNTTIVNKTTNITNVTYVNRNVRGAVTAVPQRTFVSAQPVGRAVVAVNARDISSASLSSRVAVAPTRQSVLGSRADTVNRVTAPPARFANRAVIAKAPPPPPPVSFAKQQAELQKNPGQPLARREVQNLRPANAPEGRPLVKIAPPGKTATPNMGRPENRPNQPGNPQAGRPEQPNNQPGNQNRPGNENRPNNPNKTEPPTAVNPAQPERPGSARPNQPVPDNSPNNNRPDKNRPDNNQPDRTRPNNNRPDNQRPDNNRPDATKPEAQRPNESPTRGDRPQTTREDPQPDSNQHGDQKNNDQKNNDRNDNARPPAPEPSQPHNRPDRPVRNDRQPDAKPADRPEPPARNDRQPDVRPDASPNERPNRPVQNDRQPDAKPDARPNDRPDRPARNDRLPDARPNDRPNQNQARPNQQPNGPVTPEERKQQQKEQKDKQERDKKNEKPPAQ